MTRPDAAPLAPAAPAAPSRPSGAPTFPDHEWRPSTLGHGETMCCRCGATNREAFALGLVFCNGGAWPSPETGGAHG